MTKQFKVSDHSPPQDGLIPHLLISADAMCFQVNRKTAWKKGLIVEVPMVDDTPDWSTLHCAKAYRFMLKFPFKAVSHCWGEEVAVANDVPVHYRNGTRLVKPSIIFDAEDFLDTPYETAKDKADFANRLVRFIDNGFLKQHFNGPLYIRLRGLFGFSHEVDRDTFYEKWFGSAALRLEAIKQMVMHLPIGDPEYTCQDVEKYIRAWLPRAILPKVTTTASTAQSIKERFLLDELIQKHGVPKWLWLPIDGYSQSKNKPQK